MTLGTLKKAWSVSGAWGMTAARSSEGPTWSARRAAMALARELAHLGERHDVRCVQFIQLSHVVENRIQVAYHGPCLFRRKFQMRQFGHTLNVFDGNFFRHLVSISKLKYSGFDDRRAHHGQSTVRVRFTDCEMPMDVTLTGIV